MDTFAPLTSPATSIRWGATPSASATTYSPRISMYSPRASLEMMRTPGGIPVMARAQSSKSVAKADIAADAAAKSERKEKKEKKSLMAKVKKSIRKGTEEYWTNGMNLHYSGVFARV